MENLTITRKSLAGASGPICDQHSAIALDGMIKSMMAKAYEKHGSRAFDCPKKAAAIHEAGHALINAVLGEMPQKCFIAPKIVAMQNGVNQKVWLGITTVTNKKRPLSDDTTTAENDLKTACATIAGIVAEDVLRPRLLRFLLKNVQAPAKLEALMLCNR